jgi:anthranilate synthase component 1
LLPINFQKAKANLTDEEFKHNVALAKSIVSGDVFQLVLSRRFTQGFKGDEFNVYRALRSINPSLIYSFDYGDFKIFGSSPEAQIIVKTVKRNPSYQELLKNR